MRAIIFCACLIISIICTAGELHVGPGQDYSTLVEAAANAQPGDSILIHEGQYSGGIFIADLQGNEDAWISILAFQGESVSFIGGNTAWQFSDAAYLHIVGMTFEQQVLNGVNFDDGGSYDSPAHHVIFEDCVFRDMQNNGNNDLLKLSGLNDFEIVNCQFLNGSEGGSGIDMVGCHQGYIHKNHFENMGSNAIQAKGGTQFIRIEANSFIDCGHRSVNLGGSTGLQYFRPIDAPFEAADLDVYSNVFVGSIAPIAYVGSVRVNVHNNTIYTPEKWVFRILQETVDTTRFPPCGDNSFRNNIVYINNNVNTEVNIGPNTDPESFHLSNNLWYHSENQNWSGPNLPVVDSNQVLQMDPLFTDQSEFDFSIGPESPASAMGFPLEEPEFDHVGFPFKPQRSIGAYEGDLSSSVKPLVNAQYSVYPNPFNAEVTIENPEGKSLTLTCYDIQGRKLSHLTSNLGRIKMDMQNLMPDQYVIILEIQSEESLSSILLIKAN